jgi:hypothetical protein
MNPTIGSMTRKADHLMSRRHLLATAALSTLLIAFVAAGSTFGPRSSEPPTPQSSKFADLRWAMNLPSMHMAQYKDSRTTYYVVSSALERDGIYEGEGQAAIERESQHDFGAISPIYVLVADSPAAEAYVAHVISSLNLDMFATGSEVRIVDLRLQ